MSGDPRLSDRSWIQTATGRPFWIFDPKPEDVEIEDIATALSRIARFGGHTAGDHGYSVAQHSVLVSRLCPPDDRLWALLHDAAEAYCGDVPSPIKARPEFAAYRDAEANIMRCVCRRFGLPEEEPESVRRADLIALATEARDLMGGPAWAKRMSVETLPDRIYPVRAVTAKRWFLEQFEILVARRGDP